MRVYYNEPVSMSLKVTNQYYIGVTRCFLATAQRVKNARLKKKMTPKAKIDAPNFDEFPPEKKKRAEDYVLGCARFLDHQTGGWAFPVMSHLTFATISHQKVECSREIRFFWKFPGLVKDVKINVAPENGPSQKRKIASQAPIFMGELRVSWRVYATVDRWEVSVQ